MGHLTEMLLLFVLITASSAFSLNISTTSGLVIKPTSGPVIKPTSGLNISTTSDPGFNVSVTGQINKPLKREPGVQPRVVSCPYGWSKIGSRCFHYISLPADWATAEGHCLNLGANLVSVHSETEYQALKALIWTYDYNENPTWLGLSDCQKRNSWLWSDGTKFGYRRWNSIEPNHSNGECCVHMNWDTQKNWNDIPCHLAYPFVCAKRAE